MNECISPVEELEASPFNCDLTWTQRQVQLHVMVKSRVLIDILCVYPAMSALSFNTMPVQNMFACHSWINNESIDFKVLFFFLSFLCGHTDIQQTLKGPLFLVGGEQAFVLIGCEQTVYHTGVETSLGLLTVNAAHYAFRHTDLADMKQVHLLNDTILTCWIKHIAEGQGVFLLLLLTH